MCLTDGPTLVQLRQDQNHVFPSEKERKKKPTEPISNKHPESSHRTSIASERALGQTGSRQAPCVIILLFNSILMMQHCHLLTTRALQPQTLTEQ